MSITWQSRIVAETRFQSVYGVQAAGTHLLRLSIGLTVANWPREEGVPTVLLTGMAVQIEQGSQALLLGYAVPETPVPFKVGAYSQTSSILYALLVSPAAMEAVERLRGGRVSSFG